MKRLFLIYILLLNVFGVFAQYDIQLSQYFKTKTYYNPSAAGIGNDVNVLAVYRKQWLGMPNAPQSILAMIDLPLHFGKTNHGVGLLVYTDKAGLFKNTNAAALYSYKIKLWGGFLSLGIQLGFINQIFDGSGIKNPSSDSEQLEDEALPTTKVNGSSFDLNFGFSYYNSKLYVGIASMHLAEPELQLDENASVYLGRSFNFLAAYNIHLNNPLYVIQPSVLLKTDLHTVQSDITVRLTYNKMFNGGLSWRVNDAVVLLLGASIRQFDVGYAYDFPISAILKASSGSHELMVRYHFKLKKNKQGKYRHKSVRIL